MAGIDAPTKVIQPQPGYQIKSLASSADIVIGGGAAGSGKTYSLLLEFLRHIQNPSWGGVVFRRTNPQIKNEGGLWDTSQEIYSAVNARSREGTLEWLFPSGAKLKFSHLEHEKNKLDWQGSQIPFIGFDEITHFSESMFFYLLSRNRSTCGIKPYVRATCNPDPESWVAKLIDWWIDSDTGAPIPERDGVIRYFLKQGSDYIWGDTEEEVIEKGFHFLKEPMEKSGIEAKEFVKSLTFVHGNVYDNQILIEKNPAYLANLAAQDEENRKALLEGNWKVVLSDLDLYNYHAFAGMFDNSYSVAEGAHYITADVALMGSDKFVVGVWHGRELIDITVMDTTDGPEVIEKIQTFAKSYKVPNRHICFDNDGVGGFVGGYLPGSVPFQNNGKPKLGENYQNAKAQCYYRSAQAVNDDQMKVSEKVADRMYDDEMTVRQRFIHERKAIKRGKPDSDRKLSLIPKAEMKVKLQGESPDLMDMFMMLEWLMMSARKARVKSKTFK